MGHNHHKHAHAGTFVLLHIIAIVLLLVSISVFKPIYWYQGTINFGNIVNQFNYKNVYTCAGSHCSSAQLSTEDSDVENIFGDSYYLALGGLICSGVIVGGMVLQYVLSKCLPKAIKKLLQLFIILGTVVSVVLDALSFGLFFRLPSVLDKSNVIGTLCHLSSGDTPCNTIRGKNSVGSWGPETGLWLVLAATILVLIACIMSIRGGKRFKYTRLN